MTWMDLDGRMMRTNGHYYYDCMGLLSPPLTSSHLLSHLHPFLHATLSPSTHHPPPPLPRSLPLLFLSSFSLHPPSSFPFFSQVNFNSNLVASADSASDTFLDDPSNLPDIILIGKPKAKSGGKGGKKKKKKKHWAEEDRKGAAKTTNDDDDEQEEEGGQEDGKEDGGDGGDGGGGNDRREDRAMGAMTDTVVDEGGN